jgi:hypothetical protein
MKVTQRIDFLPEIGLKVFLQLGELVLDREYRLHALLELIHTYLAYNRNRDW